MTNVIFESHLHNIYLESNLIFRPVLIAHISASARWIFFHFLGDNQDQLAAYIVRFLKNSVGRKKNKRTIVKKRIFFLIYPTDFF